MATLNVIGLISGGKDSFFSLLHCVAQGHRIVALANLYPPEPTGPLAEATASHNDAGDEEDLSSFMYQTVGHEVVPLYAAATGLPLYRQPIEGRAVQQGLDYTHAEPAAGEDTADDTGTRGVTDETESMTLLLRHVRTRHPEANAVCAGAILSTYQRTRVESVAVRLGLVSLAFLWQYPLLPARGPSGKADYLDDLAAAGFDARIVKVASAGLDDRLLWTNVASPDGRQRVERALARFAVVPEGPDSNDSDSAPPSASALGEGGEYETLVVDGPRALFRCGTVVAVADGDRRVVHEGGGSAWLQIRRATLEPRTDEAAAPTGVSSSGPDSRASPPSPDVRMPGLLDPRFAHVLSALRSGPSLSLPSPRAAVSALPASLSFCSALPTRLASWAFAPKIPLGTLTSTTATAAVAAATQSIVDQVRLRLHSSTSSSSPLPSLPTSTARIIRSLVVLRDMAHFPTVNAVYADLFRGMANPPARVTIACGDQLPDGVDVAVVLSVLETSEDERSAAAQRDGLHVQSRSYWAPANIGPYSQAIAVPAARLVSSSSLSENGCSDRGPRVVAVAGQIPLVPATMELSDTSVEEALDHGSGNENSSWAVSVTRSPAPPTTASFALHTTLALQHLWRIGIALGVQWWSSAVAYIPRQERADDTDRQTLVQKAVCASHAWRAAHLWAPKADGGDNDDDNDDDDNDDDDGPDLWDRTYNARYTTGWGAAGGRGRGGTGHDPSSLPNLPNWRVICCTDDERTATNATAAVQPPPMFLAEVDTLPRNAPVEWHAHAGYGRLRPGSVTQYGWATGDETLAARQHHVAVELFSGQDEDSDEEKDGDGGSTQPKCYLMQSIRAWPFATSGETLCKALQEAVEGAAAASDVVYVDRSAFGVSGRSLSALSHSLLVPCRSLWSEEGEQLAAVVVSSSTWRP